GEGQSRLQDRPGRRGVLGRVAGVIPPLSPVGRGEEKRQGRRRMKIRNRGAIKALGFFGSHFLNLWLGTVRYRYRPLGPSLTPDGPQRFIYALWHEHMLILAKQYQHRRLSVMISTHADGQLITEVIRHLGFHAARGSTTREGATALREMLRRGKTGSLA